MGNNLTPAQKALNIEKQVLSESGLELDKDLKITDVPIKFQGEDHQIHTLICGIEANAKNLEDSKIAKNAKKEILIILHGYAGGSLFFFQTLKDLSEHYQVYCIDHLGMGLSSRPEFKCQNLEETLNFFLDSFESWREKIGITEKFVLCGHSFGGYIASQYARKFKQNVKGLILLSPLGFTKDALEWNYLESEVYVENLPFFKRYFHRKRLEFFKEKGTVSELSNSKLASFLGPVAKFFWKKRFKTISSHTANLLWEFLQETFKLPNNSEKALHYVINPNIVAYEPIEGFIDEINVPVSVLYGDNDWMCQKGAMRYWKNQLKKDIEGNNEKFRLFIVEDCEHQMTITNPKGLIQHFVSKKDIINKFFEDLQTSDKKENKEMVLDAVN